MAITGPIGPTSIADVQELVHADPEKLADKAAHVIRVDAERNPYLAELEGKDRQKAEDHFKCECKCKRPVVKHHEDGVMICAACRFRLNVDTAGQPYRRLPGDLDSTVTARLGRAMGDQAEKITAEMKELVQTLPPDVQKRLATMPEHQFKKHAKEIIRRHLAIKQFEEGGGGLTKNARRRMANRLDAQREEIRQAQQEEILSASELCTLCGQLKLKNDHDGHGLGECVEICEGCGGAGEIETILGYVTADMASDADEPQMEGMPFPGKATCPACRGSGAIFPDTEASRLLTHPEHDVQERMDRAPAETF